MGQNWKLWVPPGSAKMQIFESFLSNVFFYFKTTCGENFNNLEPYLGE